MVKVHSTFPIKNAWNVRGGPNSCPGLEQEKDKVGVEGARVCEIRYPTRYPFGNL